MPWGAGKGASLTLESALDIITVLFGFRHLSGSPVGKEEEHEVDELVNRWIAALAQMRLIRYLN